MPTSSATSWMVVAWYPFSLNNLAAAAMISLVRGVLMRSPSRLSTSLHPQVCACAGRSETLRRPFLLLPPDLTKHLVKEGGLINLRPRIGPCQRFLWDVTARYLGGPMRRCDPAGPWPEYHRPEAQYGSWLPDGTPG